MGSRNITLIRGDGIGPEVIDSAVQCIEASGLKVRWDEQLAGGNARNVLPQETLESIRKNRIALKGPITTPVGEGFRSVNVELRKQFDLFANVRPAKIFQGARTRYSNIDIVVIRENIEDLYAGIEFKKSDSNIASFLYNSGYTVPKNSAISIKFISESGSERIAKFAFEYAKANKRKKVTVVHKANIMKYTDGLFLDVARKVAKKYRIQFEDAIVDNMSMQLVQKPELYDVLLCPNLYGDILSDLCAGLVGGLGLMPGANIGETHAIFETVHGSAPKYAGQNKVNPTAAILAGAMMLRYMGEQKKADLIENAVAYVIKEGKNVTYDISGKNAVGTKEMTDAIIKKIEAH